MADPKYVQDFVQEILPHALEVGTQYGIDPVTIITQAAIETGWGREVAGNNYFGVKSHGRPGGQQVTTHEEINGKRVKINDDFRKYGSLAESVADYGSFLSSNPRYANALSQPGYRNQLRGIAGSGYATSSDYSDLAKSVSRMVDRNVGPIPPGLIPNPPGAMVGTQLDTRRAPPTPAIPSIAAAQLRANSSPSGGNTALQTALNAEATKRATAIRNRVTPATMQGRATTVATIPTTTSLTTPGAVNSSVNSTRQQPALAAALQQRLNPVSASDKTRNSPAQTRNVATTIASIPTVAPARLPSIPQSAIGRAPATRAVTTTRITPSASDMARAAAKPAVAAPRVPLTIGAQSSFAGQDRAPALSQARLGASAPGLPALYGTMSQNRVNSIGLPLSNQVSPTSGFRVTSAAPTPLARPGLFGAAQPTITARQPVAARATAPMPAVRPSVFAARVPALVAAPVVRQPMPMAQPARAPLAITVNGSNTIQPAPMSAVQQLQAQGLSAAEAYARLTGGANPDAASRINGKSGLSSSGGSYTKGYEF